MKFTAYLATCLSLGLSFLFCTSTQADDWSQFRGPQGNASADGNTPSTWNDSENIAWKIELPGKGASSPILVGDKILLTAFSGYGMKAEPIKKADVDPPQEEKANNRNGNRPNNRQGRRNRGNQRTMDYGNKADLRLHTICLDRKTGKLIWNQSVEASPNEQAMTARIYDHGYASGTPVTDGESVFSYFGTSGMVAYDLEGNELWHNKDLGTNTAGFGSASSPSVNEDFVFVNASIESNTLFALDKKTGKVAWKREGVEKSWSMPVLAQTVDGETELIINQKFKVYGLDPKTGNELWSCEGIQDYVVPVPIHHEGILYCLGGRSNKAMAIKLGGRGDVTQTHRLWLVPIGANVTSPLYHDGHLYWASDKGIANCMDATNGKAVYRERMPTKARVYASIVRGGDNLYLTTRDSGVWVLPAKPEFKEVALNKLTDENLFNASPTVDGDRLLLRTDKFLYCIGSKP